MISSFVHCARQHIQYYIFISILVVNGLVPLNAAYSAQPKPKPYAVASAHPLATQAGMDILAQGGNAFDAAVAVSATLAVVEPYSSGMGGGGFWLLHRASDQKQVMIDGREKAPGKAHERLYQDKDGNVIPKLSIDGALAAGIPGQAAALVHLAQHYGRLPLSKTLQPAIDAAKQGFVVTSHYRRMAEFRLQALRQSPAAAKVFLHNNQVPQLGYRIIQQDLANTLQQLAQQGRKGFYQGNVAQALVKGVQQAQGIWQLSDLKQYKVVERQPIISEYQGYRIVSAAPPSSGGVALATIFNILKQYDFNKISSITRKHLIIEAMRRAYYDRATYLGDTDFVKVPLKKLQSMQHARQWRESIQLDAATPSSDLKGISDNKQGRHTTHFSILDGDGNRVAATLSVNYPFGSCFMPPGTGILLNDEMDDFSAKPGVANAYGLVGNQANAIAPHKRMLSSMSPSFVEGQQRIAIIGTPGGSRIITMVLHGILATIAGKDAEQIVSQPRFHHQYLPDVVQYEKGAFSEEEMAELQLLGHQFREIKNGYGNMQLVLIDKKNNKVTAASDPRGEGQAQVKP